MYPETKHHTIEEVSIIFDEKNANVDLLNGLALEKVEKETVQTFEHRE